MPFKTFLFNTFFPIPLLMSRCLKVEKDAEEEEKWEKKFMGSRTLYRLKLKATTAFQRPTARKNHPGETYNPTGR